jgi:hypothetical protein
MSLPLLDTVNETSDHDPTMSAAVWASTSGDEKQSATTTIAQAGKILNMDRMVVSSTWEHIGPRRAGEWIVFL